MSEPLYAALAYFADDGNLVLILAFAIFLSLGLMLFFSILAVIKEERYANANHAARGFDDSVNRGSPAEWDESMGGWESCGSVRHETIGQLAAGQRAGKD